MMEYHKLFWQKHVNKFKFILAIVGSSYIESNIELIICIACFHHAVKMEYKIYN